MPTWFWIIVLVACVAVTCVVTNVSYSESFKRDLAKVRAAYRSVHLDQEKLIKDLRSQLQAERSTPPVPMVKNVYAETAERMAKVKAEAKRMLDQRAPARREREERWAAASDDGPSPAIYGGTSDTSSHHSSGGHASHDSGGGHHSGHSCGGGGGGSSCGGGSSSSCGGGGGGCGGGS